MTLRKQPSDFFVDEHLSPDIQGTFTQTWSSENPFAILHVRKESLTTPEAAGILCKALHLKSGAVEYAGLKDKHAITTQHMSVMIDPTRAEALAKEWSGQRWKATLVGFAPMHLRADAIARNRFSLTVRDLSRQAVGQMNDRATQLRTGSGEKATLGIINYFGDQRFGSARHGQGFAAKHLVKAEFEAAVKLLIATPARKDSGARRAFTRLAATHWGDWEVLLRELPKMPERAAIETLAAGGTMKHAFVSLPNLVQTLCVEAFQSYLWNDAARRMVEAQCARAKVQPMKAADDFGDMAFVPAKSLPPEWKGVLLPMPSPEIGTRVGEFPTLDEAMRAEGLRFEQLVIPNVRRPAFGAAERALAIEAMDFTMSPAEKDELASERSPKHLKRRVEFELPRGSYATVVMRALGE